MNLLEKLFSIGRLRKAPPEQMAGRVLAPASVQRTQLGLRAVDLPVGTVKLRTGELQAFIRITGTLPILGRSDAELRAAVTQWAAILNALPSGTVLLSRSAPGGLAGYVTSKRQQQTALATSRGVVGSALARLAGDQLAHGRQLQASGAARRTVNVVAIRDAKGDVSALKGRIESVRRLLKGAGIACHVVTDTALLRMLAETWQPAATEHLTFDYPEGGPARYVLNYAPGNARVTVPRYVQPALAQNNGAPGAPSFSAATGKALPR